MMDIKDIFARAIELPPEQRKAFLDECCAGDAALRSKVEEVIAAHEGAAEFLDDPTIASSVTLAPTPPPQTDPRPQQVGPYKLIELIGEGGFGTVYMAEQEHPVRRRVALKIIKAGMDTRQVIARFEAERQALAMMDHPGIARVFDAGATANGRPYFVMELVRGLPITQYCDQHHLDLVHRLELFVQVCHAVQHAHQKGLIHRDIKPGNVLVSTIDDRPAVKVIDFGIAKATEARLTEKTLFTEFHQFIGTPEYMSPEQAETGTVDVDTRSDVYSLGVLLYELLTGATPFDAKELRSKAYGEIQRMIREIEPPNPSRKLSTLATIANVAAQRSIEPRKLSTLVRGELDWIVMRCLEKDRARRYDSAAALAGDVQKYLSEEPIDAGPPSRTYRLRKLIRRHKLAIGTAAFVAIALVVGLAVATWGLVRAVHERDHAVAARQAEIEAREYAQQSSVFLEGMFTSLNPDMARGKPVLVKEILDQASRNIDARPPAHRLVEASLRTTFGQAYAALGSFEQARRHLQKAVDLYKAAGASESIGYVKALSQLGSVLDKLGKAVEAEPMMRDALRLHQRLADPSGPDVAETKSLLAGVVADVGHWNESVTMFRHTIQTFERARGAGDARTLTERLNLAEVQIRQGRPAELEKDLRELLDASEKSLGEDHPTTVGILVDLADAVRGQGRDAEAVEIMRRALDLSKKVFGPEHLATLDTQSGLTMMLDNLGRRAEAEPLYQELIEHFRRAVGEDHPSTLAARMNYAEFLQKQGKRTIAEAELRDIAARSARALGEDHEYAIRARGSHAWVLMQLWRYAEAETILRDDLPRAQRAMGDNHPYTVSLRMRLATVLNRSGKFSEAEPFARAAYESARASGKTQRYAGFAETYGWCEANLGKANEAVPLLLDADHVERSTGHPDKLDLWLEASALIACYEQLAQPDQAQLWRQRREELGTVPPLRGVASNLSTVVATPIPTTSSQPSTMP